MIRPLTPADVIAFLIIAGLIALRFFRGDGSLDIPASVVIGYYFGQVGEIHRHAVAATDAASASDQAE